MPPVHRQPVEMAPRAEVISPKRGWPAAPVFRTDGRVERKMGRRVRHRPPHSPPGLDRMAGTNVLVARSKSLGVRVVPVVTLRSGSDARSSAGQPRSHMHEGTSLATSATALILAFSGETRSLVAELLVAVSARPLHAARRGSCCTHLVMVEVHLGLHRLRGPKRTGITRSINGIKLKMSENPEGPRTASTRLTRAGLFKSSPLQAQSTNSVTGSDMTCARVKMPTRALSIWVCSTPRVMKLLHDTSSKV